MIQVPQDPIHIIQLIFSFYTIYFNHAIFMLNNTHNTSIVTTGVKIYDCYLPNLGLIEEGLLYENTNKILITYDHLFVIDKQFSCNKFLIKIVCHDDIIEVNEPNSNSLFHLTLFDFIHYICGLTTKDDSTHLL